MCSSHDAEPSDDDSSGHGQQTDNRRVASPEPPSLGSDASYAIVEQEAGTDAVGAAAVDDDRLLSSSASSLFVIGNSRDKMTNLC